MEKEIWKDVGSPFQMYEVSTFGRCRNKTTNHILSMKPNMNKYIDYNMKNDYGKWKTIQAHRLIMNVFVPNIDNMPLVGHLDDDGTNPRLDNLVWCSSSDNLKRAQFNNKINFLTGSYKKVFQYDLNNNLIKEHPSVREAARQLGKLNGDVLIRRSCKEENKIAYGFLWKYENILINGEEWKDLRVFSKIISVSNMGRVRSYNDRVSSGTLSRSGYRSLSIDRHQVRIHRLVALAFLPTPINGQVEVNHLDFNRENNKSSNLEWATPSQNSQHTTRKTHCVQVINCISDEIFNFKSIKDTCNYLNVCRSKVYYYLDKNKKLNNKYIINNIK